MKTELPGMVFRSQLMWLVEARRVISSKFTSQEGALYAVTQGRERERGDAFIQLGQKGPATGTTRRVS